MGLFLGTTRRLAANLGGGALQNIGDALLICRNVFKGAWAVGRVLRTQGFAAVDTNVPSLFTSTGELIACFGLIVGLLLVEAWQRRETAAKQFVHWPWGLRWAAYQTAVIAIVLFGQFAAQQFIYFQF